MSPGQIIGKDGTPVEIVEAESDHGRLTALCIGGVTTSSTLYKEIMEETGPDRERIEAFDSLLDRQWLEHVKRYAPKFVITPKVPAEQFLSPWGPQLADCSS